MKHFFTILFVFFALHNSDAQNAYYDAVTLGKKENFNNDGDFRATAAIVNILISYLPDSLQQKCKSSPPELLVDIINTYYGENNKFIPKISGGRQEAPNFKVGGLSGLISSAGGIDVTNFADGLAKFLVERFKQELTITFFQKFKEDISDKRYEDLQTLFPQTYKVLMVIDKDVYQFSAYLNTLREGFISDLTNMYVDIKKVRHLPKYNYYFNTHPVFAAVIDNAFYFIDAYMGGKHPGKVIAEYNPSKYITLKAEDSATQQNLRASIQLLQQISRSFTSKSQDHYWVPVDSIETFFSDEVKRNLYFGLLHQVVDTIRFTGKDNKPVYVGKLLDQLVDDAGKVKAEIQEYQAFIQSFSSKTKEIQEYIEGINAKAKKDVDYNDYYKVYNGGLDLIEKCFSVVNLPYIEDKISDTGKNNLVSRANKLIFVARTGGEIYVDVRTKNYSSAILNTAVIYDTLFNASEAFDNLAADAAKLATFATMNGGALKDAIEKAVTGITEMLKDRNKFEVTPEMVNNADKAVTAMVATGKLDNKDRVTVENLIISAAQKENENTNSALKAKLLTYGTFAAAVAQAQNSDDVKKAIESIALPAGSATIKKSARFDVGVQAYVGFQAGHLADGVNGFAKINNMGISAPIGIALSTKTKWGGARSLFFSLLDIGAIVQYRFSDGKTNLSDSVKIRLENIFSPGAYYVYGIPKVPISIGGGFQWQPSLTRLSSDKATVAENSGIRYNLFIAVDLPLLTLHNVPSEKK